MRGPEPRKRMSKRLLVAALGVATVSYVGSTGCAPDSDMDETDTADNGAAYDDEDQTASMGEAKQGLNVSTSVQTTAASSAVKANLPTSGNLMPPPGDSIVGSKTLVLDRFDWRRPIPGSGNLMAPPYDVAVENIEAIDTAALAKQGLTP